MNKIKQKRKGHSLEAKEKMRLAKLGKKLSVETKKRMSDAQKKVKRNPKHIEAVTKRLLEWLAYLSILSVLGDVVLTSTIFDMFMQSEWPIPLVPILSSTFVILLAIIVIMRIIGLKIKDRVIINE